MNEHSRIIKYEFFQAIHNGTIGKVVGYDADTDTVHVSCEGNMLGVKRCSFEEKQGVRTQYPLKPAFALTIHKAQGNIILLLITSLLYIKVFFAITLKL